MAVKVEFDGLSFEQFINKFFNPEIDEGINVYHYTSFQSLVNIINSQSFWMTDIRYLNDSLEYQHGIDEMLRIVNAFIEEGRFKKHIRDTTPNYEKYCEKVVDVLTSTIRLDLIQLKEKVKQNEYDKGRWIFTFSLSKKPDLLSQWVSYAREGGVAVGFNLNRLKKALGRYSPNAGIGIYRCIYKEAEKRQIVEEILHGFVRIINRESNCQIEHNHPWFPGQGVVGEAPDLWRGIIPLFKDESFSAEEEYRILASIPIGMFENLPIGFRSNGRMLIPFFKLLFRKGEAGDTRSSAFSPLNISLNEILSEIVHGPNLETKLSYSSLNQFIENMIRPHNPNCKIEQSGIPFVHR